MDLSSASDAVLLYCSNYLLGYFVLELLTITFDFVLHYDVGACVWYYALSLSTVPFGKLRTMHS